MTETYYEVLGVSPEASIEEIEAAYRERLKETHPDLSDRADASDRTQQVIRARDVLTDEDERNRYDRLGHRAYVSGGGPARSTGSSGDGDAGSDGDSAAAAAARQAGWGEGGDRSTGDDPGSESTSSTGRRHRTDRRARERAARERVARERAEPDPEDGTPAQGGGGTRGRSATSPDGGQAAAASATASTDVRDPGAGVGPTGQAPGWANPGGYSVRQNYDTGLDASPLFEGTQAFTLLAISVVLYPVVLFSALFPPFPLEFRSVVAVCAFAYVGYLQSQPEVGVVVFGVWTIVTPLVLVTFGLGLTSLLGIAALVGTALPLGLSLVSFWILYF